MSGNMKKVLLIGRLGADPEIKAVGQSHQVVNVGLATSVNYKDKSGEEVEKTTWHDLQFWNKSAEVIAQYARKGSSLYVEGMIEKRERDEGGYYVNVKVKEFQFLDNKGDSAASTTASKAASPKTSPKPASLDLEDDDIPF